MKMIITLITFFLSTLTNIALGASTPEYCMEEGMELNTVSVPTMSQECKQLIFNKSNLNAYRNYEDRDIIVYGHKNLIFAYLGPNSGLGDKLAPLGKSLPQDIEISGRAINIDEILALDVDFKNMTIMALVIEADSGEKAIYTFQLWLSGNHVPIKIIKKPELANATNIRVDTINQKVYVLFDSEGKAIAYDTRANNMNNFKNMVKSDVVDALGNNQTSGLQNINDIAFSNSGDRVFLLDNSKNKIQAYNSQGLKNRNPIEVFNVPNNIDLQIIEYDSAEDKVVGVTPQGKRLKMTGEFIERAPASESQGNENAQGQGEGLEK